jgi:phospholipid/cholesterol/gamma-HCH transport system substrate-binding protein
METKANYTLIGLFTLAVVFGVFGFIYWFQNIGGAGERSSFRVQFDGSVSGLRTGASVLFNGIRVGEVTKLRLNPEKPEQVVATISVHKSVAIRPDTEIGLEFQGLTGIASIALKGGSADKPALAGDDQNPPMLVAPPGATQDVTQAARDTLRRVDDFLAQNQQAFHDALVNVRTFTAALAKNSDRVDSALANIDQFTSALARNSDRLDKIAMGIQNLAGGEDGKSGEINEAAKSIRTLADNLDKRTASIEAGVNRLTGAGTRQIDSLSSDAHRTLAAIERAVNSLERNPSRIIFGGSGSSLPEYNGRR